MAGEKKGAANLLTAPSAHYLESVKDSRIRL